MTRSRDAMIDSLNDAREAHFTVLHAAATLPHGRRQDAGLREGFVRYLDAHDHARDLSPEAMTQAVRAAYQRLTVERPDLATVARVCCQEGQSVRKAESLLGLSKSTIGRMRMEATSLLAGWTDVDIKRVDYELSHLETVRETT